MVVEARRSSGVPGRSMSLVPTLTTEKVNGKSENKLLINVGGVRYETYKSTLKNIPDTRLSWMTESTTHNSDYDPETKEYFFDRHPGVFNMVLNYYRTGKLHAPTDVCGPLFEEELAFWGIDEKQIEPCCWMTYRTHRDAEETLAELDGFGNDDDDADDDDADIIAMRFGITEDDAPVLSYWQTWRPRLWKMQEDPYSSTAAKVMAAVSIIFVLLSISVVTMETHIIFRTPNNASMLMDFTMSVEELDTLTSPHPALDYLDYVCVIYFTAEFILRLVVCPSKVEFFKTILNWVDILYLIPFFMRASGNSWKMNRTARTIYKVFRTLGVMRIFKLTRHFSGLKILGHTIKASAKEMLLLIMFLVIFILIFACLVYLFEQIEPGDKNDFKNIPVGMWWACVTMTTLGYGDFYPRTLLGYLIGAICAVAGVLVLALPVPVIVNNFALYYSHAQARLKLPKKRQRVLVGAADMLKTQSGMPGESLSELGDDRVIPAPPLPPPQRSPSPSASCGSDSGNRISQATRERKTSSDSVRTDDSGFKTGDSGGTNSIGRISVIFTDETCESTKTIRDLASDTYEESVVGRVTSRSPPPAARRRSSDGALTVNIFTNSPHGTDKSPRASYTDGSGRETSAQRRHLELRTPSDLTYVHI